MSGLLLGTSLLLAALPAAAAELREVRRYALVAGANDGGPDRVQLRFATSDARQVAAVLGELGGVAPADRIVLLDPTLGQLEDALAELERRIAADEATDPSRRTEALVYYSGHSDETGLLLGGERLEYKRFRDAVDALDADVRIAVLDSCASGALVMGKGGQHIPAFLVDESTDVAGHAFLTSSSADEASQETDRLGASYFTHALVTGLRGGADTDRDGLVTLNEAYRFAYSETLARTETTLRGAQHPHYDMQLTGTGDLVMTDLRATSATMELGEDLDGRLFIRDEREVLVAEMVKPAGRPVALGLPPGWYKVTLEQDGRLRQAEVQLVEGNSEPVDAALFSRIEGEVAVARGGPVEQRRVPFSLGILPELAIGGSSPSTTEHNFAFGLVASGASRLEGFALSTGANYYEDGGHGVMVSAGANVARGAFDGTQVSAGLNAVDGPVKGAQVVAGANLVKGNLEGAQVAAGLDLVDGAARGLQVAAGIAVVTGSFEGVQLTGGAGLVGGAFSGIQLNTVNIAGGPVRGAQLTGGGNFVEGDMAGLQVATVNVATGATKGAQVGVVNVGGRVRGLQLGVVNVAQDLRGVPIGLVSFSRTGIFNGAIYTSDLATTNLALMTGSRRVYNIYHGGWSARPQAEVDGEPGGTLTAGGGLGVRLVRRPLQLDADLVYTSAWAAPFAFADSAQILSWRVVAGLPLHKRFTPFAGVSVSALLPYSTATDAVSLVPAGEWTLGEWTLPLWPGFVAGLRI